MLTPTIFYTTVGHTQANSYNVLHYCRSHMLNPTIFYTTVGHTYANSYNLLHYSRSNTC